MAWLPTFGLRRSVTGGLNRFMSLESAFPEMWGRSEFPSDRIVYVAIDDVIPLGAAKKFVGKRVMCCEQKMNG